MLDEEHRTIAGMRDVFARLKALALGEVVEVPDPRDDGKTKVVLSADPAFMKLYLDRVLGPVRELASSEEIADLMKDAPPAVIDWWSQLPALPS